MEVGLHIGTALPARAGAPAGLVVNIADQPQILDNQMFGTGGGSLLLP